MKARSLVAAVALAAGAVAAHVAHAAQWSPSRPIEFVVHTSPGGGTDTFARAVADMLGREKIYSQPTTVSNRTGGAGGVAFNYVKSKKGDPHVVLGIATGTLLTAASRPELGLGLDNYTPVAFFAMDPQAIAVPADSKFKTMKDLVEAGKREPMSIPAAITSATGSARLFLYLLERETGAKYKFVSFKGGSEATTAVLGGHVPFTPENLSEMMSMVESKKMRVLAVTGEKRLAAVPDTPTLKELGYNIVVGTGRGFAMPAGVSKEAAASMEASLKRVHDSAAWKEFAKRFMYEDTYLNAAQTAEYLAKRREEMAGFLTYISAPAK
ncbi:MAG TPA: tripartite tricarboxylate transporter substrate binding protein [Burkholderiales bacterium]|nr:tripartite tricarboxylate transporter substrate binding protein [Burkholderiales bacterium]